MARLLDSIVMLSVVKHLVAHRERETLRFAQGDTYGLLQG
jgi:hypothetical protein